MVDHRFPISGNLSYPIESGVALGDRPGHLGGYLSGIGLSRRCLAARLRDVTPCLSCLCPGVRGFRTCGGRFPMRLRDQHLSMR